MKQLVKSLSHKKGWVFDLDGTLTLPVHDFALIRRELNIAGDEDILGFIHRQPPERMRTMLEQLDELELQFAALAKVAEGAEALLHSLDTRGCVAGILTRNSKDVALRTLESVGLDHYFIESMVLGRVEAPPKPSPVGINILIKQWGMNHESVVMVGDFHYDLLSGRSAQVSTVHVDKSDRSWPEETDIRVKTLSELRAFI
mgnify:CR=1 FL=1